jgi:hypothetical protein
MHLSSVHRNRIDNTNTVGFLDQSIGRSKRLFHHCPRASYRRAGDLGPLPEVLVVGFRDRHIERSAKPSGERLQHAPLLLE